MLSAVLLQKSCLEMWMLANHLQAKLHCLGCRTLHQGCTTHSRAAAVLIQLHQDVFHRVLWRWQRNLPESRLLVVARAAVRAGVGVASAHSTLGSCVDVCYWTDTMICVICAAGRGVVHSVLRTPVRLFAQSAHTHAVYNTRSKRYASNTLKLVLPVTHNNLYLCFRRGFQTRLETGTTSPKSTVQEKSATESPLCGV